LLALASPLTFLGLNCGPLSRAILQKSEDNLREILRKNPAASQERTILGQTPLHLSANWPLGLGILLELGLGLDINAEDIFHRFPLHYAISSDCVEAVDIFLQKDCALYTKGWYSTFNIAFTTALARSSKAIIKLILKHLVDRRHRLQSFAEQNLPVEAPNLSIAGSHTFEIYDRLIAIGIEVPYALHIPTFFPDMYFRCSEVRPLEDRVMYANMFYDAGFHDVDGWKWFLKSAALGDLCSEQCWRARWSPEGIQGEFDYINWLISKGAKLTNEYGHPTSGTYLGISLTRMPTDMWPLRQKNCRITVSRYEKQFQKLLNKVLVEPSRDDCNCFCSTMGCCIVTQILKATLNLETRWPVWKNFDTMPLQSQNRRFHLIHYIEMNVLILSKDWKLISLEFIRFETFTSMGLTHTCCCLAVNHLMGYRGDTLGIHEDEAEMIAELEKMVSEFTTEFSELDCTLIQFMDGPWKKRMDKWNSNPMTEEELAKLRELGVVLEDDRAKDENTVGDAEQDYEEPIKTWDIVSEIDDEKGVMGNEKEKKH
jgi:hypothetical protein